MPDEIVDDMNIGMPKKERKKKPIDRDEFYLTKGQKKAKKQYEKTGIIDDDLDGVADRDDLDADEFFENNQAFNAVMKMFPSLEETYVEAYKSGWFDEGNTKGQSLLKDAMMEDPSFEAASTFEKSRLEFAMTNGPTAAQEMIERGSMAVKDRAVALGINLSDEQVKDLGAQYWYQGWGETDESGDPRKDLLDDALNEFMGNDLNTPEDMGGEYADLADKLKAISTNNGISFNDNYYNDIVSAVMRGESTEEDALRQIREQAAGYWPSYSDRIIAGSNARDLASGFLATMARDLEIDVSGIDLNDPLLRKALTGVDDKGNPAPQSMWEFQMALKDDPRWMETNNAQNTISSSLSNIAKVMGGIG